MIDWFVDKFRWMLLFGAAGLGYLGYLAYLDYHEPLFEVHRREIVQEPYAGGQSVLEYRRITEVHKACAYDVRRYIIDADGFRHDLAIERDVEAREPGTLAGNREIIVPEYLPDGPAVYLSRVTPKCTWLQRIFEPEQQLPALEFTVRRVR